MSAADANKILAQVIDKVDDILFKHGLTFRDDDKWEDACEELRAFVEKYYDDVEDDEEEEGAEPSDAETLSSEDEDEESDEEEVDVKPKRARK